MALYNFTFEDQAVQLIERKQQSVVWFGLKSFHLLFLTLRLLEVPS